MKIPQLLFWGGNYFTKFLPSSRCWLIWDKKGREWNDNFSDCEIVWTNTNKPSKIFRQVWMGLIQEGKKEKRVHPTQKPIQTIAKMMNYLSEKNIIVLDLFGGSGSTLVACEQTNRICYMMEIDERYTDVIRKRYTNFIGKGEKWQKATPKI